MADYKHIIPFILQSEGGLSSNPNDAAAKNPVPDGSGNHTNKGITWETWNSFYPNDIANFYAMPQSMWDNVFKHGYWDKIQGDSINSQPVADLLADWVWGSGSYYPAKHVQGLLGLTQDGIIGSQTIAAINAQDSSFFNALQNEHANYIQSIAVGKNAGFLDGWMNRLNNLTNYVAADFDLAASAVGTAAQSNSGFIFIVLILIIGFIFAKKYF
jgi:lysozyme family protein